MEPQKKEFEYWNKDHIQEKDQIKKEVKSLNLENQDSLVDELKTHDLTKKSDSVLETDEFVSETNNSLERFEYELGALEAQKEILEKQNEIDEDFETEKKIDEIKKKIEIMLSVKNPPNPFQN